jgi:hypothetical protein
MISFEELLNQLEISETKLKLKKRGTVVIIIITRGRGWRIRGQDE